MATRTPKAQPFSEIQGFHFSVKTYDRFFHFLVSPAGKFSKKARERLLESMKKPVLWAFHTNFLSRVQPWPREPPKEGYFRRSKVSTFPRKFCFGHLLGVGGYSLLLPYGCYSACSGGYSNRRRSHGSFQTPLGKP